MRAPASRTITTCTAIIAMLSAGIAESFAIDEFDKAPINYREATPDNCVTRLQKQIDEGQQKFQYEGEQGYLKSLLKALNVPIESQMLVFSKTSLQQRRIAPRTPRAIYFNEDVYVGYCQSGDVLELSAVDPQLGTVFYTLDQDEVTKPRIERRNDNCLVCHSSSRTGGVPGHVVRSLYVDAGGQPIFSAGSRTVDHTTPIEERWGGWYVTGRHGQQSHVGNLIVHSNRVVEPVDNSEGQNVVELKDHFSVDRYVTPHSDIVALMVMEHQTMVHNCITKASFSTRQAFHYEKTMNKVLGYGEFNRLDSTTRRIANAADKLVEALLLSKEAPITSTITGTSGYADVFTGLGPRDSQGRSLRDLDMTTRMFKYPCSYLIYSEAFDALPQESRDCVWRGLWDVLSGENQAKEFAHLTPADRRAIAEIIRETKTGLPEYWKLADEVQVSSATPEGPVAGGDFPFHKTGREFRDFVK